MIYRSNKKKFYKYKLDGFDKNYTEPSNKNEATYTNLSPGTYTFHVAGTNCDGVWNDKDISIQIIVLPYWYQTYWFMALVAISVVAIFYLFYRYRNVLNDVKACKPDVVLMDIDMPHVNGVEGVKLIRTKYSNLKILMQTVFEDDDKIFASICAGADGYILKKTPPHELIKAINDVIDGRAPMTPSIARQVLRLMSIQSVKKPNAELKLTAREHEILSLLVQGLSYKMISQRCFISLPTVNSHIQHIYDKLHVSSGTEAVAKAIKDNLL